ncbi:MAG: hypothetical protein J6Y00_05430 [Paludibacteraceae bacterium]|nr:hypothetical protein [Paludibacteraceae bacterium]
MQRRFNMYRRMIVIGMIMLMEFSLSSTWAFTQSSPSWRSNSPMADGSTLPDYRFRSTSPLLDGSTPYAEDANNSLTSGSNYGALRGGLDDPGVGEVDDPVPVGEPLCLLLIAAAYGLFIYRRKKA